jgi:undecaprenyl diphosphate synthase
MQDTIVPKHIAFIMDGNGRWAKSRGLPRSAGHKQGIETVGRVISFSRAHGIQTVSLYAFSTENWTRPKHEIDFLFAAFKDYLGKKKAELAEKDIRLTVSGRREGLPSDLCATIDDAQRQTASCRSMTLNISFNYGARAEIADACRAIAGDVAKGIIALDEVDEAAVSARLYHAELPDVDLLIRTSGEQRISNYMLWQCSYAELYFVEKHWPDFSDEDYQRALDAFAARSRRFGTV